MSLAFYASPLDESYQKISSENNISYNNQSVKLKKKRRRKEAMSNKVSVALENIHNNLKEDDDDLDDFNPPPHAESSGIERLDEKNNDIENLKYNLEGFDNPHDDEYLVEDEEPLYVNTYYKKELNEIPNYNFQENLPSEGNDLEKKLDYVIKLLESQKNEKTDHVTEELVLYTFLGIFVIYIADSFVKVGKYVR